MTPGYREIMVAGEAVHAYVGGGRIEGFAALAGAPTSAVIDGETVPIRVTWAGGDRFVAEIVEAAADVQATDGEATQEEPAEAAANGTEDHHDE